MLNYKILSNQPGAKWVVMIHGAGGNMEVWFKQVAEYSRHFNLLLIDLACHGESNNREVFTPDFDFDVAAAQVMEVVDHVGIKKAHFMGLSLGSIIVHAIVNSAPERAHSMVLVGAVTSLNLKTRFLFEFVSCFKRILPFSVVKYLLVDAIIPQPKYNESKRIFKQCAQKITYEGFLQWMRLVTIADSYIKGLFRQVNDIPTLYVMGEDDSLFLCNVKNIVSHSRDNVSLHILPNAGHVCNIDNKEGFNQVSLGFLSKC